VIRILIFPFTQKAMPREYARKTDGASWSETNLLLASQEVKTGKMTLWNASKTYKTPYRTLKRRTESENFVKRSPGPAGSLYMFVTNFFADIS
jgi:hypothetical protein